MRQTLCREILEISPAAYAEIAMALSMAGYGPGEINREDRDGLPVIDMPGVALREHPGRCQVVVYGSDYGADTSRVCGASLVRCRCGAKWCLDHQVNPLVCPGCAKRGF